MKGFECLHLVMNQGKVREGATRKEIYFLSLKITQQTNVKGMLKEFIAWYTE